MHDSDMIARLPGTVSHSSPAQDVQKLGIELLIISWRPSIWHQAQQRGASTSPPEFGGANSRATTGSAPQAPAPRLRSSGSSRLRSQHGAVLFALAAGTGPRDGHDTWIAPGNQLLWGAGLAIR